MVRSVDHAEQQAASPAILLIFTVRTVGYRLGNAT
jgi:hypothetical protein